MSLEIVSLAMASKVLVEHAIPILQQYLKAYRKTSAKVKIEIGGTTLEATSVTPELVEKIQELIRREPKLPNELSTARQNKQFELPEIASQVAPFALAISPETVFRDARKRIALVFKINLAVSIVLAAILLIGIGGAVYSAVFVKKAIWSLAFGGLSAADLIGVYVFKPLSAINAALIGATRLDTLQLRLNQQLSQCAGHDDLEARIRCQTAVWDVIQHELSILASSQPQTESTKKKKAPLAKIKPVP